MNLPLKLYAVVLEENSQLELASDQQGLGVLGMESPSVFEKASSPCVTAPALSAGGYGTYKMVAVSARVLVFPVRA